MKMNSHKEILGKYINKPLKILEWGPGESTQLMLDSNVTTIEHDKKWFDIMKNRFKDYKNIEVIYKEIKSNTDYATIAYENAPYDLIFIDGRRRLECAIVAMQVIKEDGVIILHDSHRENYRKPLEPLIKVIEEKNNTLVFKKL